MELMSRKCRLLQVHTLCNEALLDAPSCAPALDLLSSYYIHVACIAAQKLMALTGLSGSGMATGVPGEADVESVSAAPPFNVTASKVAAQDAVKAAARNALTLLNHLMLSDPVRTMYWSHRHQDVEALVVGLGLDLPTPAMPQHAG